MTRDEIFERVRELLTKTFGLPAEKITPTAQKLLQVTEASLARAIEKVRIGNTVGDVGAAERRSFAVIGDTTNTAARLMAAAARRPPR